MNVAFISFSRSLLSIPHVLITGHFTFFKKIHFFFIYVDVMIGLIREGSDRQPSNTSEKTKSQPSRRTVNMKENTARFKKAAN